MITQDKAEKSVQEAERLQLYGWQWFKALDVAKVRAACNGCGPAWMGEDWRDGLTEWLDLLFTAFCLHDCRFTFDNDGTRERFDFANDELDKNCRLLVDSEYGWYNPMRYIWRNRARLVAKVCRDFGWSAWRDAYGEILKSNKGENK